MKNNTKILLQIYILLLFSIVVKAQNKKMELSTTIGFVINHGELDNQFQEISNGGHLGFNLYSTKEKRFKSDLQLSMNISGNSSSSLLSINGLYGGRYYFTKPDKSTAIFGNALIGGAYISEIGDDFIESSFGLGYSVGVFMDLKKIVLGISSESFNNFILKAGYKF